MKPDSKRLDEAYQKQNYLYLNNWAELYIYQYWALKHERLDQVREISRWAQKKWKGFMEVKLPLINMMKTESMNI